MKMIYNRNRVRRILLNEYEDIGVTPKEFYREFDKMSDREISKLTGLKILRKGFFIR